MSAIGIRPAEPHEMPFVRCTSFCLHPLEKLIVVYCNDSGMSFRSYATLFPDGRYKGTYFADTTYAASVRDVKARSQHAIIHVAVAQDTGSIVGAVDYHDDYADQKVPGFGKLAVEPSERNAGIAEQLVRWCIKTASEQGAHRLLLHTTDIMPGAQRLYKRLGFKRFEEIDFTADSGTFVMGFELELQTAAVVHEQNGSDNSSMSSKL